MAASERKKASGKRKDIKKRTRPEKGGLSKKDVVRIYLVQHVYKVDGEDDNEEVKLIGVYSTKDKAKAATRRLAEQVGFKDYPDGFIIGPMVLNRDYWATGFIRE